MLIALFISCGGKEKKAPSNKSSTQKKEVVKKIPVKKAKKNWHKEN